VWNSSTGNNVVLVARSFDECASKTSHLPGCLHCEMKNRFKTGFMNTDRWLCWHRPTTYSHSERFHLAFPSHILSGMASTHLVNTVVFIHIWPPGLAFTSAQESLEGPLLEICVLGFFYIHTVQTMQILLAAGPVFPAELVLASLGCFCLADGVGYFFLAPNKALVVATTQPNTVLLLLLTKAGEASDWNPPPAPAPPSCWGM